MVKVSIIMPVYNSIKYLEHAIKSVIRQDFEDMELILVDDGSDDGSAEVCDKFAEKDCRIKVIHKANGGICSARNAGLFSAQGEYVGFCDNDDEFLPGLISENYELAHKNNADLVRFIRIKRKINTDGKTWDSYGSHTDEIIEKKDFAENYFKLRKDDGVWSALYKRKILVDNGIIFDVSYKYGEEDHRFNIDFIKCAQTLVYNSRAYYIWMQRDIHSTSRKFHREHLEDILRNADSEYSLMKYTGIDKIPEYDRLCLGINSFVSLLTSFLVMSNCPLSYKEKKDYLNKLREKKIFKSQYDIHVLTKLFKTNKRMWLIAKLFINKRYGILFMVLKVGDMILSFMRYK